MVKKGLFFKFINFGLSQQMKIFIQKRHNFMFYKEKKLSIFEFFNLIVIVLLKMKKVSWIKKIEKTNISNQSCYFWINQIWFSVAKLANEANLKNK